MRPVVRNPVVTVVSIAFATSAVLLSAGGTAAASGGNSVHVKGPTSNTIGQPFKYTVSGHASGKANYLVAWEQLHKHKGCASTYAAESTRTFQSTKYGLGLAVNRKVKGSYKAVINFQANVSGTHGLCAYLIGLSNGKTYAHGSRFWNNHQ